MLQAILNESWRQHPTKQQLYGYLPLIMKTIQGRRTRYAGHCWRSRTHSCRPHSHGRAKAGWQARTYIKTALCQYRKTYRERSPIEKGGEGGLGRFVLAARHDDDDGGIKWFNNNFPKIINTKGNVMGQLEAEIAYDLVAIQ